MSLTRILTSDQVDDFLRIYELDHDLPSWERAAVTQGLAMAREALAEAAPRIDPSVDPETRFAVHARAAGHCDYCAEQTKRRGYGQSRMRHHRELDHMLSKYGLIAVGATWDVIHHEANLCSNCVRCNYEKGTTSLPPIDLERMWTHLAVAVDDPVRPLLRFYSQLLEEHRFRIRRFDPAPPTTPKRVLGALKSVDPPTPVDRKGQGSVLLRHHPRRLEFIDAINSSDDNRELWTGPGGWRSGALHDHRPHPVKGAWWGDTPPDKRPGRPGGHWNLP